MSKYPRTKYAQLNIAKYGKQPSWDIIESFLKEIEMTMTVFEQFYAIPKGLLPQVKGRFKKLPPEYWHLFYEKIKPTQGAGFIDKNAEKILNHRVNIQLPDKPKQGGDKKPFIHPHK